MVYVLLLACFFVVHIDAFFGPSEETKNEWEKIIANQSYEAAKSRLQLCPKEADYVLSELDKKIRSAVTKNAINERNGKDTFHGAIGAFAIAGALFLAIAAFIEVPFECKNQHVAILLGTGGLGFAGGLSGYNCITRESTKHEERNLSAIKLLALEMQKANNPQQRHW